MSFTTVSAAKPPTTPSRIPSTGNLKKMAAEGSNPSALSSKLSTKTLQILLFICGWYICSGVTLFGNKHMLSSLHAHPDLLAMSQMTITFTMGGIKVYGSFFSSGCKRDNLPVTPASTLPTKEFLIDMAIVGIMRVVTVLLGLISLKYVAVSFTETVKSSAPFFTVLFARLMLGERTSLMVNLSLIPVVGGLALCSASELSFTLIGFSAAIMTNCIDCVQNVFSKKLLSTKGYNYVNLQFFTSAAALLVQLPVMVYLNWGESFFGDLTKDLVMSLVINGIFFHMQSVMAYGVMGLVSPVTQSVVNTLKRALLICISIQLFHNDMAILSAVGTAVCVLGVLAYNYASRKYPYRAPSEEQEMVDLENADETEVQPLRDDI
jgi:solute carrier family 35 protein E2